MLGAEVSFPRPERLEKGGKPPAEFHARADQLGQFAIDWLYQAQWWVQAEGFTRHVAKIVTYLRADALAWWRDVGDMSVGTDAGFLQFKVAFLQRFIKLSDTLKASTHLQECAQGDMTVEAFASKFRGIANRIVVGNPVDKTTQAMWFLKGLNGRILNRLQSSVEHAVLMDIDTVIPAVNIEANLDVAAGQAERKSWGKGNDKPLWGKGKGSPGQGSSGQANTLQKGGSGGKQNGAGRLPTRLPGADDICHNCKKTGHWARHCPEKPNNQPNKKQRR